MRFLFTRPGLVLAGLFVLLVFVAMLAPGILVAGDPLAASARDAFSCGDRRGIAQNALEDTVASVRARKRLRLGAPVTRP